MPPSTSSSVGNVVEVVDIMPIDSWGGPSLTICNASGIEIAIVPLLWTQGIAETYGDLAEILEPVFEDERDLGHDDDDTPWQWQVLPRGQLLSNEDRLYAGEFVLRRSGVRSALVPSFASAPPTSTSRSESSQASSHSDKSDSRSEKSAKCNGDTGETEFEMHCFIKPTITTQNRPFTAALAKFHGKRIKWDGERPNHPSAALARIRYAQTLGQRFCLIKKVIVPPWKPTRRSVPSPEVTPRATKRVKRDFTAAENVGGDSASPSPAAHRHGHLEVDIGIVLASAMSELGYTETIASDLAAAVARTEAAVQPTLPLGSDVESAIAAHGKAYSTDKAEQLESDDVGQASAVQALMAYPLHQDEKDGALSLEVAASRLIGRALAEAQRLLQARDPSLAAIDEGNALSAAAFGMKSLIVKGIDASAGEGQPASVHLLAVAAEYKSNTAPPLTGPVFDG
ncbi:hypothetical protein A1Q2_06535 [Trichosporon asahii var. asahii CBS 8904]|uniref:Uncharacterized protein n=1 Tax=Trichosporon asahii var. asahii (strain CBS 8904) TaxID=1220162 RepID=K1VJ45_TRIAC|nr:hypothetical protein A1Q2_06535 [Trichosporon asahii var. asahii CBS 8904]